MKNRDRAEWARQLLEIFPYSGDEAGIRDILADLMHLCREDGRDFEEELRVARDNFESEI